MKRPQLKLAKPSVKAPPVVADLYRDLRDYRKRLDALKAQNPFEQQFETSGLEGTEVESGTETLESVTAGGGDVAAADIGGSTSIPSSGSTTASSPDTSSGSTEPVSGGDQGGEPEVVF